MSSKSLCAEIVERHIETLQLGFETHPFGEGCVIVTPFSYPDLASIEIVVEPRGDSFLLTDEGETLNMLFVNGLTLEANKALLREAVAIAGKHGVTLQDSVISVRATKDDLGEASHRILSAIQAVGYMLYRRRHRSRPTFDDEVEELLLEHEVRYEPNRAVRGKANMHRIKFYMNENRNILLEPIAATTVGAARNKARAAAYKWLDIGLVDERYRFAVVIDDRRSLGQRVWSDQEARSTIETHSHVVVRWEAEAAKVVQLITDETATWGSS